MDGHEQLESAPSLLVVLKSETGEVNQSIETSIKVLFKLNNKLN